jgi:UDP-N-acetylmuramoyl-tripeptide--D-alanyl-D-alanine ligase
MISILKDLRDWSRPMRKRYGLRATSTRVKHAVSLKMAHMRRARSDALHIGITGSSGKSTTTALLAHILEAHGSVHAHVYRNTLYPLCEALRGVEPQTRFVVAEIGASVKGSISAMAGLLRPDVAVVTKVGLQHYSAFRGKEAVGLEKGTLVEALPSSGLAILNADDPHVMAMAKRTKARVVTFGRSPEADYRLESAHASLPTRLSARLSCEHGSFDLTTPFVSEEFWLATLASFAASVELGVSPEIAKERIATFSPPWNRCGVIEVAGGPTFIVDTAKAPNEEIPAAIEIIKKAQMPLKRVVIGQISDYPGNSIKVYRTAYQLAAACSDQVVFINDYGHRARVSERDRETGKFVDFTAPKEAADHVKNTARPGEVILLKGSQNLHLERLALCWTHDVQCWERSCGKTGDCVQCGMVEVPFEDHRKVRRERRRRTPRTTS